MAHGYEPGKKFRGGEADRKKADSGVGKNDEHGKSRSEQHSQKAKGNPPPKGSGAPKS